MKPVLRSLAIPRPRLIGHSQNSQSVPLTIVCAPAGYGKTVLAQQWVELGEVPEPGIHWIDAREARSRGASAWDLVAEALPLGKTPAISDARMLVRRWVAGLDDRTVVVIDGYECVTSAVFDGELAALLQLSEFLQVWVLARRVVALDGPLVTSRITVRTISQHELQFTPSEVQQLAASLGVTDDERAAAISAHTGGWPLAVHLSLLNVDDPEVLLARLLRELVAQITHPDAKRALWVIGILRGASIDLLSAVMKITTTEAFDLAQHLEDSGLVSRTWHKDTVRFSAAVALSQQISHQASRELSAEEIAEMKHQHATELMMLNPLESARVLRELGDFDALERVVTQNFAVLLRQGGKFLSILRTLTPNDVPTHTVLLGARLLLELPDPTTSVTEMSAWLNALRDAAYQDLKDGGKERPVIALSFLVKVECMRGSPEAYALAQDLERRLGAREGHVSQGILSVLPTQYAVITYAATAEGDFEMARRAALKGISAAQKEGNAAEEVRALNMLALLATAENEPGQANMYRQHARELQGRSEPHELEFGWIHGAIADSLIAWHWDNDRLFDESVQRLEPVLHRAVHWPMFAVVESQLLHQRLGARDALMQLRVRIDRLVGSRDLRPPARAKLSAASANLAMIIGNYHAALEYLSGEDKSQPLVQLAWARLSLMQDKPAEALSSTERLRGQDVPFAVRAEALLLGAVAAQQLGEHDEAEQFLRALAPALRLDGGQKMLRLVPYRSLLELIPTAQAAEVNDFRELVDTLPTNLRFAHFASLTPAELNTLQALHLGKSIPETASLLFISQNTMKFHLRSIYQKLQVSSRAEAVLQATRMGLFDQISSVLESGNSHHAPI